MTVAVAFPGQGAYSAEAARSLVETFPEVAQVYAEVDEGARAAGAAPVSDLLRSAQPPGVGELLEAAPESLQLSIYAVSVAISRLVTPAAGWAAVSVGHSLGEIAALQAGGAFTVPGGAEIVAHRARALRAVDAEGGLLALACDATRARDLLALVGSPDLAVAALNAPRQTVVSGPHADLATVATVAKALRIGASALPSPYAFHNPRLGPVAEDFAARIEHVSVSALSRPVYSPIIGRFYEDSDDVRALVTRHLVDPVDFVSAVRQLRAAGVTAILECASGTTLGLLATRCTEGVETTSAAQRGNERAGVEQARQLLAAGDVPASFSLAPVPAQQAPEQVPEETVPEETVPVNRVPVQQVVVDPQRVAEQGSSGAPSVGGRAELFGELAAMYAEALEYPAEVFSEDVALEAELGVDSVKQTELFARTVERYELALPDEAVQLAQFDTMGKVVDLVWSLMPHPSPLPVQQAPEQVPEETVPEKTVPEETVPEETVPEETVPVNRVPVQQVVVDPQRVAEQGSSGAPSVGGRAELFGELAAMYAEALEYPAEVFSEDVALEAELGVDSVKQTELFARTVERYELALPDEAVQLAQFDTMGKVVDLVWSLMPHGGTTGRVLPARSAA